MRAGVFLVSKICINNNLTEILTLAAIFFFFGCHVRNEAIKPRASFTLGSIDLHIIWKLLSYRSFVKSKGIARR